MKKRLILIGLIFTFGYLSGTNPVADTSFEQATEHIIMREIGHKILLHSGDSSSRVLPIQKVVDRKYQIHFESPFSFSPDSIVSTIDHIIDQYDLSNDYVVNVFDCKDQEIIYGYAIMNSNQDNIIPCSSRPLPKNCYYLTIQFSDDPPNIFIQKKYGFGWLPFLISACLGLFGLWWFRRNPKKTREHITKIATQPTIGEAVFSLEEQYLMLNEEKIALTPTEAKLLNLFVHAPNQVIQKSIIQKEIWQHDGEIISRSLDVFISKLRKKLKEVENVSLVNVHGKGYRLEVLDS